MMDNSILNSIKSKLGVESEYDVFDSDIIDYVNSVFNTLTRLGVGPKSGFYIVDEDATWEDYDCNIAIPQIKAYMYCKVRMLFDPPTNGTLVDALNKQIAEFEWTMNIEAENNEYSNAKEDEDYD